MTTPPVEKRFAILSEIVRAQHFAWREAVRQTCPDIDPRIVVEKMWELTGIETARAYLRHLDASSPLAPQVAESIAWSSQCMGEDAVAEHDPDHPNEAFVRHRACPWKGWHEHKGLLDEDRPGCDQWFEMTIRVLREATGQDLRFETLEALPDGNPSCLRRIWIES